MKKTLIISAVVILVILGTLCFFASRFQPDPDPEFGITFSQSHAEYMGYNWKSMYLDILNDLQPKKIRLVTYWEQMEKEPGLLYFQDVDEMLTEAGKRGIEVVLVVGHKQPRWPECHHPYWYNDLNSEEQIAAQLSIVRTAVDHFKKFDAIKIWQVENEGLFSFGPNCPQTDKEVLKEEIAIVRSIDDRPVMLTDSGEFGRWVPSAKLNPDILGSTMYRVVHNPKIGYYKYPMPPVFFRIKAGFVKTFTDVDKIIGVELQAEPWFTELDVHHTDLKTQYALMNPKIFVEYVGYAKKVGFEDNYLWGVEWWYWLAQKHGDWGMWTTAKELLKK